MDNPEIDVREKGGGHSRMDNPETQTILDTTHRTKRKKQQHRILRNGQKGQCMIDEIHNTIQGIWWTPLSTNKHK